MFGDVAYCTVLEDGNYYSCDTVPDDHQFGLSADGRWQHVEGAHLPDDRIVAFGLASGSMTDPGGKLAPRGHGPAVPEARKR